MQQMMASRIWLVAALCMVASGCRDSGESKGAPEPAQEVEEEEDSSAGSGTAMALDEGRMGKLEAQRSAGAYAMKNEGTDPGLARAQAVDIARSSGLLGALHAGQGGGGAAYGSIGTGRYATIGHGSGVGVGHGAGQGAAPDTESYRDYGVNPMTETAPDPLSTFAVDVDTASYAIARRKLRAGALPPPAAIRVEEFINYFHYDYPGPTGDAPFAVHMDAAPSPFARDRHILRVGVQARKLANSERKPAHLVFLVDVSGSMQAPDKLTLAKRALRILVDNLRDGDTVALVTYAGNTRVVLEPTGLAHKGRIAQAIESLSAAGSTAMSSGIELAYGLAARSLQSGAVSRVIVLSDGDANVGDTSHEAILQTIAGHVAEGVTLSTVGFGMGNYKDALMEQLANQGDGNYYYIDGISQARRVFQEQLGGTLEVVARDVKIQVAFDPESVARYRLVGYENRDVADRDFRNDRVDAGEIGAGHRVTALYEVELRGQPTRPLATVRVRAKKPRGGGAATEWAHAFDMDRLYPRFAAAPEDLRFATAVMAAAEVLRASEHARGWRIDRIIAIARAANARQVAERRELVTLLRASQPRLARRD